MSTPHLDPVASTAPPVVRVRDLRVRVPSRRKVYAAPVEVLRGLTFTAPAGQVTALVGANGAGKTTALRAITTALPFAEGSIELLGTALGSADVPLPSRAAHVPDDPAHPEHWTAHDVARLLRRLDPGFDVRSFGALLTAQGVPHDRRHSELSRGQVTQLSVAAAIAQDPQLLILDEPFARLDPLARTDLVDQLRAVMAREERAIVLATHDLEGMERFVDHLVVIAGGQDVLEGDVESLREEFLVLEAADDRDGLRGAGSPLIGPSTVGGRLRALVGTEDVLGLPPGTDLRRPTVSELVTHWLRAAGPLEHSPRRTTA